MISQEQGAAAVSRQKLHKQGSRLHIIQKPVDIILRSITHNIQKKPSIRLRRNLHRPLQNTVLTHQLPITTVLHHRTIKYIYIYIPYIPRRIVNGGRGGSDLPLCATTRAVDANILMVACTLKHTVFKLPSLVNMVAFESLRLQKMYAHIGWGGETWPPWCPPGCATELCRAQNSADPLARDKWIWRRTTNIASFCCPPDNLGLAESRQPADSVTRQSRRTQYPRHQPRSA